MRITKIEVKNLFGYLNHTIDMKKTGITILYGLNSAGKTTILNLIHSIFSEKNDLVNYLFDSVKIWFDNSEYLLIEKKQFDIAEVEINPFFQHVFSSSEAGTTSSVKRPFYRSGRAGFSFPLFKKSTIDFLDSHISSLEHYYYTKDTKITNKEAEEIANKIRDGLEKYLSEMDTKFPEREWFRKLRKKIDINLIKTQRIQFVEHLKTMRALWSADYIEDEEIQEEIEYVIKYSNELKESIKKYRTNGIKQYKSISGMKDYSNSLKRYLSSVEYQEINSEELEGKKDLLRIKINYYSQAGLLDKKLAEDLTRIIEKETEVFGRYCFEIAEVAKILTFYDDLGEKLLLFIRLLQEKFRRKLIAISEQYGIGVFLDDLRTIELENLSSGEKQLITIFYNLIFETRRNTFILIDEPELSLHVSWQEEFINDLIKIMEFKNLYFLIATHSPQIISNHWDSTVELEVTDE